MDTLDALSSDDPRFTHLDLRKVNVSNDLLKAIADTIDNNTSVRSVSWKEEAHYDVELKKKIEDKVELNNQEFLRHPNDLVYSLLSKHVYTDSEEGDSVQFVENGVKEVRTWNRALKNWSVFKVFNHPIAGGYYGVAYLNEERKQIVLAHRGTTLEFWNLLKCGLPSKTDVDGILGDKIVAQQKKARVATEEVIRHGKIKGCNVSFTGHSLGAWLAELSLYFTVRNHKYFHSKAVTFDSPGSASAMESFQPSVIGHVTNCDVKNLDVTTYLSAPNLVNCCNAHIGKVYRMFPNITWANSSDKLGPLVKKPPIVKNFEPVVLGLLSVVGHLMTPIVSTFDAASGMPETFEKVLDWPQIKYQPSVVEESTHETLNSVSVLKFLPGIGWLAHKAFSKPFFWTWVELVDQFVNKDISSQQFWEMYSRLEFNAPLGETVRPSAVFDLFCEGHYCTQELNPSKLVYSLKTSDWYLHQLCKLSRKKISRKEISDDAKEALKNFKDKYRIKIQGSKKYFCVLSADSQVDDLREKISNLCGKYSEIREILENENAYTAEGELPNQSAVIVCDLPPRSKNIVDRPAVLEAIKRALDQHKCLVISAPFGIGKSTVANEYGRSLKGSFSGEEVYLINADSADKISTAYRLIAEHKLSINVTDKTAEKIAESVYYSIASSRSSVLFIFDNVESSQDVEPYLGGIRDIDSCRVIITSRNKNLSNNLNVLGYELDPFTKKEAELFVVKNSTEREFSPQEVEYLIDNLCSESFVLPFNLSQAVAYLNQNKSCTVDNHVEDLKKSTDATGTFLLLDLVNTSELSFYILQYSAYLDPDFITIDIFKELLSIDEDSLQVVLEKLESLSLVNLRRLESNHCSFQLHRLVQESVKKYADLNKHLEIIIGKEEIFEGIVKVLSSLFPVVRRIPNEDWQTSQRLYPHTVKILQNNICCNKQVEMSELNFKLENYCFTVACDYAQALVYHDQALALRWKQHKGEDTKPETAESNDDGLTSKIRGYVEKTWEWLGSSLTMVQRDSSAPLYLDFVRNAASGPEDEGNQGITVEMSKILQPRQNSAKTTTALSSRGAVRKPQNNAVQAVKYLEDSL